MKTRIVYLFIAVMGLFVITSCDHNNPNGDKFEATPSAGYLFFAGTLPSITPATDSLHFTIKNSAPVYSKEDIVVSYELVSIEGPDPSSFLHSSTSTVTIPAGMNTTSLSFDIDAAKQAEILQNNEQIVFKVVLHTEAKNIEASAEASFAEFTYPCSIEPAASYVGQLSVPAVGYTYDAFGEYDVAMTETATNIYHVTNLFNPNWVAILTGDDSYVGGFNLPATLIIDPATFEVQVIAENPQASDGGTGTYNACDDLWSFDVQQSVFTDTWPIHVELLH